MSKSAKSNDQSNDQKSDNQIIGKKIRESKKMHTLIAELVQELSSLEEGIQGIQPPDPSRTDRFKGMMEEVAKGRGRPLFYPFIGSGSGRGAYVELEDGSVKLDLINGIGIHILGHGHAKLREAALRGALSDVTMQGNLEPNFQYHELTKKLVALAGRKSRLKYAWFSTCGTMANESALKIARQKHTPAKLMLSFQNAFAGRSTMMAELTDNPAYREGLPEYHEVLRIPFYDSADPQSSEKSLRILKEHVANNEKNIAVFAFEPMLGEGGYRAAPREFFIPMLEFCRQHKIANWADEVQTFMRTGELFAFETLDIGQHIDICTVAKTLQTGATLYTEEYNPKPGLIAGTFSGSSVSLEVGLEALNVMTEGGYFGPEGRVQQIHKEFLGMLNRLNETTCKGLLREAGGMGLMVAVTPLDGSKDMVNKLLHVLFKNGMIAFSCGRDPYRLRFLVPACIQSKDIEAAGKILEKSVLEIA